MQHLEGEPQRHEEETSQSEDDEDKGNVVFYNGGQVLFLTRSLDQCIML